jgi:predicted nuclease of predicted toxin-antitoxin system
MAAWISAEFELTVVAVRDLGLREATDRDIFLSALQAGAVVMTRTETLKGS